MLSQILWFRWPCKILDCDGFGLRVRKPRFRKLEAGLSFCRWGTFKSYPRYTAAAFSLRLYDEDITSP